MKRGFRVGAATLGCWSWKTARTLSPCGEDGDIEVSSSASAEEYEGDERRDIGAGSKEAGGKGCTGEGVAFCMWMWGIWRRPGLGYRDDDAEDVYWCSGGRKKWA